MPGTRGSRGSNRSSPPVDGQKRHKDDTRPINNPETGSINSRISERSKHSSRSDRKRHKDDTHPINNPETGSINSGISEGSKHSSRSGNRTKDGIQPPRTRDRNSSGSTARSGYPNRTVDDPNLRKDDTDSIRSGFFQLPLRQKGDPSNLNEGQPQVPSTPSPSPESLSLDLSADEAAAYPPGVHRVPKATDSDGGSGYSQEGSEYHRKGKGERHRRNRRLITDEHTSQSTEEVVRYSLGKSKGGLPKIEESVKVDGFDERSFDVESRKDRKKGVPGHTTVTRRVSTSNSQLSFEGRAVTVTTTKSEERITERRRPRRPVSHAP